MTRELDDLRYLIPPEDSFWTWGDAGDVVEWRRGGTIAFREQLRQALTPFADGNLPPLELVLLVLAACRDSWKLMSGWLLTEGSPFRSSARPTTREWWSLAVNALSHVHDLPYRLRTTPAEVATIIEIALERVPVSDHRANGVLEILSRSRWLEDLEIPDPLIKPAGVRVNELNSFMHGLTKLTPDRIESRLKTGLDRLPLQHPTSDDATRNELLSRILGGILGPARRLRVKLPKRVASTPLATPEPVAPPTVRQLLDELIHDQEFSGLVRLVNSLNAVLTLPRELEVPDDLPQGGVSDISNRGPLDRLLLSELAHDDDTLTMRIALNEALYIRRESPPSNPARERVLLIDAGIRTWGLPRLCATAVALCLASQDEVAGPARVFRSSFNGLKSVDLTTREGLIEHLAALDHLAHPASVLPAWLSESCAAEVHRVFITSEDVLSDREFRRELDASGVLPCFIVTVNREGKVRLVQRTTMGERLLREMWLDLDEVAGARPRSDESLDNKSVDHRVPAILKLDTFPLRLPTSNMDPTNYVVFPRGEVGVYHLLQILKDRRLLLWDAPGRGARQLTDRLPSGKPLWSGQLTQQGTSIAIGYQHPTKLTLITVRDAGEELVQQPLDVGTDPIRGVCHHLGMLFVVHKQSIDAIDPLTGKRVSSRSIPSNLRLRSQRYFSDTSGWYAVSFDGLSIRLEEILHFTRHNISSLSVIGIVGKADHPVAVLSSGEVLDITQRTRQRVVDGWQGCHIAAVSHDGNRFVIRKGWGTTDPQSVFVSLLPNLVVSPSTIDPYSQVMPRCWTYPSQRSLYVHLARLGHDRRSLMVVTKKDGRYLFQMSESGQHKKIALRKAPSTIQPAFENLTDTTIHVNPSTQSGFVETAAFQEMCAPAGVGFKLKHIIWSDGSRAVLDSRGMLHLQSSDPEIPELTLVMHDDNVAAWCADGRVWGSDYFLHDTSASARRSSPQFVMDIISKFVKHLPT